MREIAQHFSRVPYFADGCHRTSPSQHQRSSASKRKEQERREQEARRQAEFLHAPRSPSSTTTGTGSKRMPATPLSPARDRPIDQVCVCPHYPSLAPSRLSSLPLFPSSSPPLSLRSTRCACQLYLPPPPSLSSSSSIISMTASVHPLPFFGAHLSCARSFCY
jgi:hypothetical protein